nr:hypothetical protein [uncultured Sphingomonas sp.]
MIAALFLAAAHMSAADHAIGLAASAMHSLQPVTPAACFGYDIESSTGAAFDLSVREIHNKECGGDPDLMLVTERFRVNRAATTIDRYDAVEDRWLPCKVKGQKQPLCP